VTTVTTKRCFRCMAGEPVAVFATTDSLATALRVSAEAIEFVDKACGMEGAGFCIPCVALREEVVMKIWHNRFAGLLTANDAHWATVFAIVDGVV